MEMNNLHFHLNDSHSELPKKGEIIGSQTNLNRQLMKVN